MKVLFDQNAPRPLARHLSKHSVFISAQLGWDRLRNGDLLAAAEQAGFEILVTCDKNLEYQQNPKEREIAIIVLPSGRWPLIQPQLEKVVSAVDGATPGSFVSIA